MAEYLYCGADLGRDEFPFTPDTASTNQPEGATAMTFTLRNARAGAPPIPVPDATEPAPGLYVHRTPAGRCWDVDEQKFDWAISHHSGCIIQYVNCRHAGVDFACQIGQLTDWTASLEDIQAQVKAGLGRKITQIREAGNAKPLCCPAT